LTAKVKQDEALLQGGPRDAAVHFDTYRLSNFTTVSCGFSATARISCWSLSADCCELGPIRQKVTNTRKNQSDRI